tara:strand:- start:364 stop:2817 length:2454 start_codon:yes stop_codon:yes gene_type:complete
MALYDDASFIFLASGAARTDTAQGTAAATGSGSGGYFSKAQFIKPVEVLDSTELLQNNDFSIDGGGTGGALEEHVFGTWGWNFTSAQGADASSKITGGVLTLSNGTNGDSFAYATTSSNNRLILTENATFKLTYTITASKITNPTASHSLHGYWGGQYRDIPQTVGTHSVIMVHDTAGSDELFLFRLNEDNDEVSIDDVSIKKLTTVPVSFGMTRDANLDATRVGRSGLIEKGRENKFLYSTNFSKDIGTWGHNGLSSVIGIHNSLGQEGYDGTNNASYIRANDTTGVHKVLLTAQAGVSLNSTAIQTISIHAKPLGYTFLRIGTENDAQEAYFDLANGTVGTTESDVIEAKITPAGNGYFRCSMTVNADQAINQIDFNICLEDNNHSFTGDPNRGGTDNGGIFIQDAQWELGLVPTEIISSNGSAGTAGIKEDEPRFDYPVAGGTPSLLLEPQRQNLFAQSEYLTGLFNPIRTTFKHNEATSPEGVNNAVFIAETATGTTHGFQFIDFPIVDGTFYSISFFVKANGREKFFVQCNDENVLAMSVTVDLSGTPSAVDGRSGHTGTEKIVDYGNGWYRVEINGKEGLATNSDKNFNFFFIEDASGTNTSYTGDPSKGLLFYGLQIEEGPYASSYIPTHGATATRSGEGEAIDAFKAQLPTALNGASAYTLFMDLTVTDLEEETNFRDVLVFRDSTRSASLDAFKLETYTDSGTSSLRGFMYKTASDTAVVSVQHDTIAIGSRCKLAVVVNSASGIKAFYNGSSTPVINYSEATTYESVDLVQGAEATITGARSRTLIHAIHGYPSALSDAQCISLTTL